MPIFRALGLGVFLLVIQLIVPSIFAQLERTIISFLRAGEASMNMAATLTSSASLTLPSAPPATMF